MLELTGYSLIHFSQTGDPFPFIFLPKLEGGWKGYFSSDCWVMFPEFKLLTCLHLFLRPDKSHRLRTRKEAPILIFSYLNYHLILPNSFWRVMVAKRVKIVSNSHGPRSAVISSHLPYTPSSLAYIRPCWLMRGKSMRHCQILGRTDIFWEVSLSLLKTKRGWSLVSRPWLLGRRTSASSRQR